MKGRSGGNSALSVLLATLILTNIAFICTAESRFEIENSSDWDLTVINGDTNQPSGNSSVFQGDLIYLSIEVSNSDITAGHDEWIFRIIIGGNSSPDLSGFLDGSNETIPVNISFGPLPQGFVELLFMIDSSGDTESLFLNVEPNPLNLTAAGNNDVALIGEPAHVGDELTASILVHNQGVVPQSAYLELSLDSTEFAVGLPVVINPGSSREISSSITPNSSGQRIVNWRVVCDNGGVASELNGSLNLQVLPSQSMDLVIEDTHWSIAEGLHSKLSIYLSEGQSREVNVEISFISQTIESNAQSFNITLNPGVRTLPLSLGQPFADAMIVRITALDWSPVSSIENIHELIAPTLVLSIESSVSIPEIPVPDESVVLPYELTNLGNSATLVGEVMAIRTSDGMILDSKAAPIVSPQESFSDEFSIESWPNSEVVEIEIVWITSSETQRLLIEIDTFSEEEGGINLPFDLKAAIYGSVSGIILVMFFLVVYRTFSENIDDTGQSRFNKIRESRGEKKKAIRETKIEIKCPECAQRLRIPSSHSGAVKCPACVARFSVNNPDADTSITSEESTISHSDKSEKEVLSNQKEFISRSNDDILSCPSCDQKLKIPLDKRPIKARCPACRCEFFAEVGNDE